MTNRGLGKHLRLCRDRLQFSADEVAELYGVHRMTVYRWESAKCAPKLAQLRSLAQLYRTTVGWLVNGEGLPPVYLRDELEEGGPQCQTG